MESETLAQSLAFDPNLAHYNSVDDEYANAALSDPRVLITTSRDPSSRLLVFAKELSLLVPNSTRLNRGGTVLPALIQLAKDQDVSDVIVVQETRGKPDGLIVSHMPYGPTAYFSLFNVTLRNDLQREEDGDGEGANGDERSSRKALPPMSLVYPHLLFHGFSSKLATRTVSILKHLFPIPKKESKRVITFANDSDYISFRHHTFVAGGGDPTNPKNITLHEVGPRFEMRLYQIKNGTLELQEAEKEWQLKPYMNVSRKRDAL